MQTKHRNITLDQFLMTQQVQDYLVLVIWASYIADPVHKS